MNVYQVTFHPRLSEKPIDGGMFMDMDSAKSFAKIKGTAALSNLCDVSIEEAMSWSGYWMAVEQSPPTDDILIGLHWYDRRDRTQAPLDQLRLVATIRGMRVDTDLLRRTIEGADSRKRESDYTEGRYHGMVELALMLGYDYT